MSFESLHAIRYIIICRNFTYYLQKVSIDTSESKHNSLNFDLWSWWLKFDQLRRITCTIYKKGFRMDLRLFEKYLIFSSEEFGIEACSSIAYRCTRHRTFLSIIYNSKIEVWPEFIRHFFRILIRRSKYG